MREKDDEGWDDTGEMGRFEGCVWVLSTISLIFLRMKTNFCHACKCLRVYSMYRHALSTLYFRYGEKYGKEKTEKKREAHDIPSAFPAFSRFINCVCSPI